MPKACYIKKATHQIVDTKTSWANFAPCGPTNSSTPFVSCCVLGDTCYEDGICKFTNYTVAGGSGWYEAGCTDPGYTDKSCFDRCWNTGRPDVMYLSGDQWACCSKGNALSLDCRIQSNVTFTAPASSTLRSLMVAGSTPTTPVDTTMTSPTGYAEPHSASSHNTLTSGAKVGIGVGVAVGAVAILLLIVVVFRQRRALLRKGTTATPPPRQRDTRREPYTKPELPATFEYIASRHPLIPSQRSREQSSSNLVSGSAPIQLPGHETAEMHA